jgi:hypothetical protein
VKRTSSRLGAVGFLACLALLAGCSEKEREPYSELLFVSDAYTLRTFDASGATLAQVGSATIPGIPGTYVREGTLVTVTIPGHALPDGLWVDLAFSPGTGGTATSGLYPVTVVDGDTFTVTDTASGTISDGTLVRKPVTTRAATYSQSGTTVTITLPSHGLDQWNDVKLDFTSGEGVDTATEIVSVIDADTFTVDAAAAAETSGDVTVAVGANYAIFGMAMHPSGKWVYTTSTYECWSGDPLCWGAGLISRFAIDWQGGAPVYEESLLSADAWAAPVSLAFSADGSLLFGQDDNLDGVNMYGVDLATGDLTLLASSAENAARLHGLAVSTDGTHVYNGARVFTYDATPGAEVLSRVAGTSEGSNSCLIQGETLYTASNAGGTWAVKTYSLADPDVPVEVAAIVTDNEAREIVVSSDGGLVVAAGFGGLKAYTYAEGAFAEAVGAGATEYIDGYETWPTWTDVRKMFRSLTMSSGEDLVAAAYFTNDPYSDALGGQAPSGVMLFSLAADGSLVKVADWAEASYSRAARFYRRP